MIVKDREELLIPLWQVGVTLPMTRIRIDFGEVLGIPGGQVLQKFSHGHGTRRLSEIIEMPTFTQALCFCNVTGKLLTH